MSFMLAQKSRVVHNNAQLAQLPEKWCPSPDKSDYRTLSASFREARLPVIGGSQLSYADPSEYFLAPRTNFRDIQCPRSQLTGYPETPCSHCEKSGHSSFWCFFWASSLSAAPTGNKPYSTFPVRTSWTKERSMANWTVLCGQ